VNIEEIEDKASDAISNNGVREFLDHYSQDERLRNWLNSRDIDIRLLIGICKTLNRSEIEKKLQTHQQLIVQYYKIAEEVQEAGRRLPSFVKLDHLRQSFGVYPEEDSEKAFKAILAHSNPDLLLDTSHEALLYYGLSVAHKIGLDADVRQLISEHPTFFGAPLLSMLAQIYDRAFIQLLSEAGQHSDFPDECAKLIEYVTELRRESGVEFCRRASEWYAKHESQLALDKSALYPAPSFRPLFTTEALQQGNEAAH
jgi:hypothetical protein